VGFIGALGAVGCAIAALARSIRAPIKKEKCLCILVKIDKLPGHNGSKVL
jgi:hypothetical protein